MSVLCINGHQNLDGMSFCEECGAELTAVTDRPAPPVAPVPPFAPVPTPTPAVGADTVSADHAPGDDAAVSPPLVADQAPAVPVPAPAAPAVSEVVVEQVLVPDPDGLPTETPTSAQPQVAQPSALGEQGTQNPAASPVGLKGYLEITKGPDAGKRFQVTEPTCVLGRWDMDSGAFPDIDLSEVDTDAKVSRKHARISKDGDRYLIEDLGSLNGTMLRTPPRLLPGDPQEMRDGDELVVGRLFLRFGLS